MPLVESDGAGVEDSGDEGGCVGGPVARVVRVRGPGGMSSKKWTEPSAQPVAMRAPPLTRKLPIPATRIGLSPHQTPRHSPVSESQTLNVLSALPVTAHRPSASTAY